MHTQTAADFFRHRPLAILMAICLFLRCDVVLADVSDTVKLTLTESLIQDNNLFRLADGVDPSPFTGKPDRSSSISTQSLGVNIDKAYSQQQLHLAMSIDKTSFAKYDYLNFNGRNANLKWDWAITSRLTGTVLVDRKQTLASFTDYQNLATRNVQTTDNRYLNLDYWAIGGWHAVGSIGRISSVVDDNTVTTLDAYRAISTQVGAKYVFGSNSAITLLSRKLNGDYPYALQPLALLDTHFQQHDREVLATWNLTSSSQLSARLTNLERIHSNFSQRDYKGNTGRIDYTWQPSAKTAIVVGAGRDISAYQTAYSNYADAKTVTLTPVWQMTEKTSLKMRFNTGKRDFLGEPFGPVPLTRQDKLNTSQLILDWKATRNIDVSANLQRDNRKSNFPGVSYKDNQIGLNVVLTF